jgi:hypothetical protein
VLLRIATLLLAVSALPARAQFMGVAGAGAAYPTDPGVVQAANVLNAGAGLTSLNVSIATSSGNLLVAFVREGSNTTDTMTVSDSTSTTWTNLAYATFGATERCSLWYRYNAPSVSSVTTTFSTGGGITRGGLVVYELRNVYAVGDPLDATTVTTTNAGTPTSLTSGSISTGTSRDVLIYAVDVGADNTFTPGGGYAIAANGSTTRQAVSYSVTTTQQTGVTTSTSYTAAASVAGIFAAFRGL